MEYTILPNTNIEVSKICLGTMTWGNQNTQNDGFNQMDFALDRGVNFFDTAELYPVPATKETQGLTSEIIGKWFKDRGTRDKIILASKKQYQNELNKKDLGLIETEIKMIETYFYAEHYHQQYLASPGSRQYCSASPTKVKLEDFPGSNYKLKEHVWENFDWGVDKCVLRSDNNPIKNHI